MTSPPTHYENCHRVTDWRPSDDGKTRQRWVYDGREECWDEEVENHVMRVEEVSGVGDKPAKSGPDVTLAPEPPEAFIAAYADYTRNPRTVNASVEVCRHFFNVGQADAEDQRDEYREILHDILMLEAEYEHLGDQHGYGKRHAAAWARAWEKFEP